MKKLLVAFIVLSVYCSCEDQPDRPPRYSGTKTTSAKIFELLPPSETNVHFKNSLPVDVHYNLLNYEYYYNGGGVAIGDINNDGLDDIYFTSNLGNNELYLNEGDLSFKEIGRSAGVNGKTGWCTGVTMVDVNADGWLDIYVCRSGRLSPGSRQNELFINNGDLTFSEKARDYGINDPAYSTQALFFDYDRDGDLDMYLLNHAVELLTPAYVLRWKHKKHPYAGDKLYRNDNRYFKDISEVAGIKQNAMGYGLGVAAGDLNNDGWPDLYVTNDYTEPDYLYINNRDGTFKENIKAATKHISNFGMGVDIADFNNDGLADIAVVDMVAEDNYRQKTNMKSMSPEAFYKAVKLGFHYQYMSNTLQLNRGQGVFSEMAQMAGISNTDWSWSVLFSDLDNDGWKDLFITNGFRKEFSNKDFVEFKTKKIKQAARASEEVQLAVMKELLDTLQEGKISNYIYQNTGNLGYAKRNSDWGIAIPSFSNGASVADLDNDGDLELVVNNIDQEAFIFKNNSREKSRTNYLKIQFAGSENNPDGVGARVIVEEDSMRQMQENYPTRGYQSSVPPSLHFGLEKYDKINKLMVVWPDGRSEVIKNVKANTTITLKYRNAGTGGTQEIISGGLFKNITHQSNIGFKHRENDYNDFEKELLLPHKMSQFGPAVAVGDVNDDGLDDFYVGGASGQSGCLLLQDARGAFIKADSQPWEQDNKAEDVAAVFFDVNGDGLLDLYVVSGGNEFLPNDPLLLDRLYINEGKASFRKDRHRLPPIKNSGSIALPADFDKDGDLDLFVGGRLTPQKYPTPASSTLLQNNDGVFTDVTNTLIPALENIGLVTTALWTDYDNDGLPDLLVAGEWMPLTLLRNDGHRFDKVFVQAFKDNVGWWYSLAQHDFDGDGDLDYIAGNLGLNYKYKASQEAPFHIYANDFDDNGSFDIVLGYFNEGELYPLRGRQCSAQQMPFIKKKFKSYHEFGQARLIDIYDQTKLLHSVHYKATNFAHSYIENLGNNNFRFKALPPLSQLSAVNGILIDDFDKDGYTDLVVAGNLYPVEVETIRNDASYGLFLKGQGGDNFKPVDLHKSNLNISGDVKNLKMIGIGNVANNILAVTNNDGISILTVDPLKQYE
ncbi:VCBS repeat-containing protein [Fulvivirgaceae bacterium BMA12]|uniref:VCBS repeat-containing protein n=1 Tax=Agaribacillus aureus TaxID=3051825 RepID=A0ABT8L7H4_9BACT|nr:VCBS repeat-containing protein [Fulvivirgaceae bacterium BMA12]